MIFPDCPAYLDEEGTLRCGLPAEVRCRFIMRSTDGPLESAMIRCPAGHWFNGPVESLTLEREDKHTPGTAEVASRDGHDSQCTHDCHDNGGGSAVCDVPARPWREDFHPSTAPAYYLGRPARLWITVMRPRRNCPAAGHALEAVTAADKERYPGTAAGQPTAEPTRRIPMTMR